MGSNSHAPCGLVTCKVLGPQGPLLTNRMREILTYGSVGGVGRKPGPYPAPNRRPRFPLGIAGRIRLPYLRTTCLPGGGR